MEGMFWVMTQSVHQGYVHFIFFGVPLFSCALPGF